MNRTIRKCIGGKAVDSVEDEKLEKELEETTEPETAVEAETAEMRSTRPPSSRCL